MKDHNKIIILDTTLRDGEQCPGASLNHREKMELARQLEMLGVDVIEAGFPIASPDDFRAVRDIAATVKKCSVSGLARCIEKDIQKCAEAVGAAKSPRIHVFLATSEIHRKFKLKKSQQEILKTAVKFIKYANSFCKEIEFSPEDASRTEPDFLAEVVEAAIDAGAKTINIPDTVGYAYPTQFGDLISYLFEKVPNINDAVISVHCHNDLGLAVSNSLEAILRGARGIECTINGLGERAGNAALEEIVMAIKTRKDIFKNISSNIDTTRLHKTSKLVSQLTGISVQRNKAIVGANAFAHESGIHQDGMLKERSTYEIMRPEDIGLDSTELVLGKHSGRHAFSHHLGNMGVRLSGKELDKAYESFKILADKKKYIYDDDLMMLAREGMKENSDAFTLDYFHVSTGSGTIPTATVRLKHGDETLEGASCGDGPVDATLKAIEKLTNANGKLLDYSIQAVTVGKDALGEANLRVAFGKEILSAKAASTDIVEASAKAYLSCINKHFLSRTTVAPKKGKKTK